MKRALIVLLALGILAYGLFESRRLLGGPEITIYAPQDGSATSSPAVTVSGVARNISFLTINDAPAYTDEAGRFSLRLTPPPGYAIFTVAATDRFGRRASAQVHITVLNYCSTSIV
ncbi:MAG TPA: hypothetical protein VHD55_02615 [Candidatus Paceibacterota bacterium]|nr:hypothetical protein [Candidatus Paceibacterota bacterium]